MSKNTDKITKAFKAKGYQPTDMEYTHVSNEGMDGGWYIDFEPLEGMNPTNGLSSYSILAYTINDVMEEIEELPICELD